MLNITLKQVYRLVAHILATHDDEITCEECFDLLDEYVERLASGEDVGALMPQVWHHLYSCADCRQEFEALLRVLHVPQGLAAGSPAASLPLRGQMSQWKAVLNSLPEAVFLFAAPAGRLALVNEAGRALVGQALSGATTLAELGARLCIARADGALCSADELPIALSLERGETCVGFEMWVNRPDGRQIPVRINSAPLRDSAGRITGAVAVLEDITPLKDAERLRDAFIASVSHEFRSPLTIIKGYATTLVRGTVSWESPERAEYLETISQEADRLSRLVSDLIELSAMRAGVFRIEQEDCDVVSLVVGTVGRLREALGRRRVSLDIPRDLPAVPADSARIEQVLRNLLLNVAEYSPPLSDIAIRARVTASEIALSVADRGAGIPPQALEQIFDPFYRVEGTLRTPSSNAGLGLAICRGIVEAHGGRIWAENAAHGGAVITFTLPRSQAR